MANLGFSNDIYAANADKTKIGQGLTNYSGIMPADMGTPSASSGLTYALNSGMGADKYMSNIKDWLTTNNTATDSQVRTEMDKYGISPVDVATAMGWDVHDVARKYDALSGSPNLGLGGTSTEQKIAQTTTAPNPTFTANGGSTNPVMADYQKNPYLDQMAQGITSQVNDNWTRNINPALRSGAMAAGGFGGSRQGVVEANALKDVNQGLSNSLASLYGGDYQSDRNRALGKYQADQGYTLGQANNNLGFANNALGYANLDSNNQQFGANYGLNVANSAYNWANGGVNNANQIQQTPINYFNNFTGNANQIAGQGGSQSQTNPGNPYISALGGMQLASNLYNNGSK